MLSTDVSAILLLVSQVFFVLAAVVFAISAIDDIFIDIYFFFQKLKERWQPRGVSRNPSLRSVIAKPELHLALMLPAWSESDIIYSAVSNIVKTLDYKSYQIFIGTYPNDKETQAEVDKLTRRYSNIHKVVTALPGPTCKADCLNHIIRQIHAYEEKQNIRFAGVIMQDAEDVVHPLAMRLFNTLLYDYDLVQIPVYSLKRKWWDLTGGHYMDEFAEFHSKEIYVRETLANVVPGAGVGTAYSRKALKFAAETGEYFSTHSLTEDYDFSFRLRDAGLKQIFARFAIEDADNIWRSHEADSGDNTSAYIATREFFPNKFWPAVRQKTRWTIGISFQAWRSFGWQGNWRTKYLFWRDRKMIFFSHAIALGFLAIIIFSLYGLKDWVEQDDYVYAPLLPDDSLIWYLAYFNVFMLGVRLIQRHAWSMLYYGVGALPMVIPRYIWGAVINYLAICRATKIYLLHLLSGEPIGWDKTAHDFPEMDVLSDSQILLGELLLTRGLVAQNDLDSALAEQMTNGGLLGRILVKSKVLTDAELVGVLGEKFHLQIKDLDPFSLPESLFYILPYEFMRENQLIPMRWANNKLEIASCQLLDDDLLHKLEEKLQAQVVTYLAAEADIFFALHTFFKLISEQQNDQNKIKSTIYYLSENMRKEANSISREAVKNLRATHRTFAEYVVSEGILTPTELELSLTEANATGKQLGEYLIEQGLIEKTLCDRFVRQIDSNYQQILQGYKNAVAA